MPNITLRQAAAWCGGSVEEKYAEVSFFGGNNDTRLIQPGQLFIVLQGARDGHDFIPMAMEKGAAAVLCSRKVGDYPAIYVEDPRIALGEIARETLKTLNARKVAVTGSVGKSTTKEMIAAVLETTYRVSKTPANHNNDIGMPMAVLSMKEDTEVAVLEMGMNHFGEIAYLSNIAHPDVAVIINVGTAHIEFLGSREGIRKAKMEITEGMSLHGKLFLNGDNDMLRHLDKLPVQAVSYFGVSDGCSMQAHSVRYGERGLCFDVSDEARQIPIETVLEGDHFVSDALAAVSVGLELGVTPENIRKGLLSFRNMAGRQETLRAGDVTLINDCYNAGPESMAASLAVLGRKQGRRIAVLADMLELGDCAHEEHYKVGQLAAKNADMLLAYGPNACNIIRGAMEAGMEHCGAFGTRALLAERLKDFAKPGDVILFKGSHGMHLEQVLDMFLKEDR